MALDNTGSFTTTSPILDEFGNPWQHGHGYGPENIPHVLTFSSLMSSAWKTYMHGRQDDALAHDEEFAEGMRRDPQMTALLQERQFGTVSLKWHIESDDAKDPQQKAICDGVTTVVKQTPRLKNLFLYLLEAMWYGKYGSQLVQEKRPLILDDPDRPGVKRQFMAPVVTRHIPLEGDKIGFHYDGTPYIRAHGALSSQIPNARLIQTTVGRAVSLEGTFRKKFILHQHQVLDAPFNDAQRGSAIYGVGIRHYVYWLAWLRKEVLASILEYAERQGLGGVRVWYYQGGNAQSKAEVEAAAARQTNRTNLLVPRFPNAAGKASEGVEFVDQSNGNASILLGIIKEFEGWVQRFIIGQTLSGGTEGSGLGGTGVAGLHAETKHKLIAYDAENLAETLTTDLVRPILRWLHPKHADIPVHFKFDVDTPDPEAKLRAMRMFFDMGGELIEDSARQVIGENAPKQDDKILSMAKLQAQQQPAIPGDGDGDGIPNEDQHPTDEDYEALLAEMEGAGV